MYAVSTVEDGFSDTHYAVPVDSQHFNRFKVRTTATPMPFRPPFELEHVYETIEERRRRPLPPLPHEKMPDMLPARAPVSTNNSINNNNNNNNNVISFGRGQIEMRLETIRTMAAAAYYEKAAAKLAQGATSNISQMSSSLNNQTTTSNAARNGNGGFCGALQRAPPPVPPSLSRRFTNKENFGIGKVKVMLRIADTHNDAEHPHFMSFDKKKRQVTLTDQTTTTSIAALTSQERGPMVAAPKMFAFDNLFTADDKLSDVCGSALTDIIPAVLEGSDGCLLTLGYPNSGQSQTMLGSINAANNTLGAIPCAISWLYKGINERRQKSGARFSVRVSAIGVNAVKPDSGSKDLLAAHATESDDSPGIYLRDDFLGGPTELRAPTAERAALFLDAALSGQSRSGGGSGGVSATESGLEPALIFTLHVYQYSLSRKGGVAGGRSRLHLIDLGGCANRNGVPLSGIGNILLAILGGQRHPPHKDHPLTPLLKDCLAPLTCHVSIMTHVLHTQMHTDALTTIQLASRIYRMRRRKHRFPVSSGEKINAALMANGAHQSAGSSADPSSSELSADTVIYMGGPSEDATDGEHPPVYLPSLGNEDNRAIMSKALKGIMMTPPAKTSANAKTKVLPLVTSQVPLANSNRTDQSLKRALHANSPTLQQQQQQHQQQQRSANDAYPYHAPTAMTGATYTNVKAVPNSLRKTLNQTTPKGSPLRRPGVGEPQPDCPTSSSPMQKITDEQWIDGPRVSRAKVAEARHLMREGNHIKQRETWIDGPKSQSTHSLTAANLPKAVSQTQGYGFMDSAKKKMVENWVENQTTQVFRETSSASSSPTCLDSPGARSKAQHLVHHKQKSLESGDDIYGNRVLQQQQSIMYELPQNQYQNQSFATAVEYSPAVYSTAVRTTNISAPAEIRGASSYVQDFHSPHSHSEDQDSGPSEVPPALPLIDADESIHHILSRHVSRESLYQRELQCDNDLDRQSRQSSMHYSQQVTEDEIARTMASIGGGEHPLEVLSHCGAMSHGSSFHIAGDAFSDCAIGERARNQFDQLARLREIFTSQLAMAEMTSAGVFRNGCDIGSVYSEPAYQLHNGPESICSEPLYRTPSPSNRRPSHGSSQGSLPSLNGIMQIAGMDQYASLRHPDGASDPNLPKAEKAFTIERDICELEDEAARLLTSPQRSSSSSRKDIKQKFCHLPITTQKQLPLLQLNNSLEAYDSGHDSTSTPRTSKHSGISRRAESGYHTATARDSDEGSFTSGLSKERHNRITLSNKNKTNKTQRQDKSLCNWLMNPFTCTYPETEGEISDF